MPRRVLLDECVPRRIRQHLTGVEVRTVQQMGWAGKKNGALIALIKDAGFDAFVTVDRSIPRQQNLQSAGVAVVVLLAKNNSPDRLLTMLGPLRHAIETAVAGTVIRLAEPS